MPDGVHILGQRGDEVRMQVSMPTDEHGFFGRRCPSCSQLFRVDADDYDALPDDLQLWCVYCGHHGEHSDFVTDQQFAPPNARSRTGPSSRSAAPSTGRFAGSRPRGHGPGSGSGSPTVQDRSTHNRCRASTRNG